MTFPTGLASCLSLPRVTSKVLFRKPIATEPLNCGSLSIRLQHFAATRLQVNTNDIYLRRTPHNRLLFFVEKNTAAEYRRLSAEQLLRQQQQAKNSSFLSSSGAHDFSQYDIPQLKGGDNQQQDDGHPSYLEPVASLTPPALAPFPLAELGPAWDGDENLTDADHEREPLTLEAYVDQLRFADARAQRFAAEEAVARMQRKSDGQEEVIHSTTLQHKTLVAFLSAQQNQLMFVISDMRQNRIFHEPIVAQRFESVSSSSSSSATTTTALPYYKSFFTQIVSNGTIRHLLERDVSVIWFRAAGSVVGELCEYSDPKYYVDEDGQESTISKSVGELRNSVLWARLPCNNAKSAKSRLDAGSLLRDTYGGQLTMI